MWCHLVSEVTLGIDIIWTVGIKWTSNTHQPWISLEGSTGQSSADHPDVGL